MSDNPRTLKHWTAQRRAKQADLIRLHRPWEHSTGPRTSAGKAASSRNADQGLGWSEIRALRRLLRGFSSM